jgi:uncharacterized protein (DUF1697 family)
VVVIVRAASMPFSCGMRTSISITSGLLARGDIDGVAAVAGCAPDGFGAAPDTYHSDVVFLKAPLTASQAMRVVVPREGVDQAWPGEGVLYFARRSAALAKSRMSSIVGTPEYQQMTIRSWTTTTKLLALLDESKDA